MGTTYGKFGKSQDINGDYCEVAREVCGAPGDKVRAGGIGDDELFGGPDPRLRQ